MCFTETSLQEYVFSNYPDTTIEIICIFNFLDVKILKLISKYVVFQMSPVRALILDDDSYCVTDYFTNHLTAEHRSKLRDLKSFVDEPHLHGTIFNEYHTLLVVSVVIELDGIENSRRFIIINHFH